jgi:hypothetical protein
LLPVRVERLDGARFGLTVFSAVTGNPERRPSCRRCSADGPGQYNLGGVDSGQTGAMALGARTLAGLAATMSVVKRLSGHGIPGGNPGRALLPLAGGRARHWESRSSWHQFLSRLKERGLAGAESVVSDDRHAAQFDTPRLLSFITRRVSSMIRRDSLITRRVSPIRPAAFAARHASGSLYDTKRTPMRQNVASHAPLSVFAAVSTPLTEVASRQPWAVVSNSDAACRCTKRRVAKICRYQSLARMHR